MSTTTASTVEAPVRRPATSSLRRVILSIALLTVVLSGMLLAFALPGLHAGPHHLPVALVGSGTTTQTVERQLDREQPGAFAVAREPDAASARTAILHREVYGAVVFDGPQIEVMTASAASPAVAQLLTAFGQEIGAAHHVRVSVADVRPIPAQDPHGVGLAAGSLPLVLGGWATALVMLLLVKGTWQRLVGAFGFAVVGSLVLTAVEQFWFGSVDGNYLLTSAGVALGIAATTWAILGLRAALGNVGLAVGAILVVFIGNPLSGLNGAPELLPAGWGTLGQLLPPGASGTLLRSTAFFDGHGSLGAVVVLLCWLALGLVLFFWGERRGSGARR